ncbi:alpha/beta fold hydrolase [Bradyrhizobium sp.]|jgi:pimeloyl-ACP methyl ester carboxylesterase|uniref:alpha/beta fold hydrolase n=1 Tax=Bradyrhizobium sp. TaxID=376 RepID=UPI003C3A6EEE
MTASERMIRIDDVELCVERKGRGEPVLCLTALGHDAHDFDPLADLLADRFEFVRVEWPGHGRSGPDTKPVSAARYAELLDRLVPALNLENPVVIGNSIGGAAGLIYASSHPVRGLVLCNSGGLVEFSPEVARFCRLFARFFAAGERRAFWYGPLFALYYRMVLPTRQAAAQRRRIVAAGYRLAPLLRQGWASFGRPEAYLGPLAESLDVPVWVSWARRDKIIPLDRCRPTIARFRHGRLSTFDAGHSAFLEQPEAFAREFVVFADDLAASPRLRVATS